MKRLLLVGLSVIALVACGNSEDGTAKAVGESSAAPGAQSLTQIPTPAQAPPIVIPQQAPAVTTNAVTPNLVPSVDAGAPEPVGQAPCLDITSPAVTNALASVPQYFDGVPWVATDIGDPCASFTWVRADIQGATGSSPVQWLFFADGRYLGTGTSEAYGFSFADSQSADTITIGYRWLVGDDPTANPTGGPALIRYQWDGSQVTMLDELPPEVTG